MTTLENFAELVKDSGRKYLYIYAIGAIRGTLKFSLDENKVQEVEQTLSALDQLLNDKSIPWNVEKPPFTQGSRRELIQPDDTTLDTWTAIEIAEHIADNEAWTTEEILRQDA
jgi:uncharacterized protein (UPF0147 family)